MSARTPSRNYANHSNQFVFVEETPFERKTPNRLLAATLKNRRRNQTLFCLHPYTDNRSEVKWKTNRSWNRRLHRPPRELCYQIDVQSTNRIDRRVELDRRVDKGSWSLHNFTERQLIKRRQTEQQTTFREDMNVTYQYDDGRVEESHVAPVERCIARQCVLRVDRHRMPRQRIESIDERLRILAHRFLILVCEEGEIIWLFVDCCCEEKQLRSLLAIGTCTRLQMPTNTQRQMDHLTTKNKTELKRSVVNLASCWHTSGFPIINAFFHHHIDSDLRTETTSHSIRIFK